MRWIVVAALAAFFLPGQANAARVTGPITQFCGDRYCPGIEPAPGARIVTHKRSRGRRHHTKGEAEITHGRASVAEIPRHRVASLGDSVAIPADKPQVLPHPAGCPRRAFCGCGVAVKVFGRPVRDLWLAANWRRFPAAVAAAGMVAWRHGHVFLIEAVLGHNRVLAYDPNGGRHMTWRHVRSLAGYRVVNPGG